MIDFLNMFGSDSVTEMEDSIFAVKKQITIWITITIGLPCEFLYAYIIFKVFFRSP